MPVVEHHDLWEVIWWLLQARSADAVRFVKVKSHEDISLIVDPYHRWLSLGNDFADVEAKKCVKGDPQFTRLAKQFGVYKNLESDIGNYHTYICEHSHAYFQQEKLLKEQKKDIVREQQGMPCFDRWVPTTFKDVGLHSVHMMSSPSLSHLDKSTITVCVSGFRSCVGIPGHQCISLPLVFPSWNCMLIMWLFHEVMHP